MLRSAIAAFALALGFAACGAPPAAPRATPEARLATTIARAACDAVTGCCASRSLGAFDGATCVALVEGAVESAARIRREAGGGAVDEPNARACLEKISKYASSCVDPEVPLAFLDTSPCDELFDGGRPPLSPCEISEQCARPKGASRAYCDPKRLRCEILARASGREGCAGDCDADACEHDETPRSASIERYCDARRELFCARHAGEPASSRACEAKPRLGEACDKTRPCASGGFCRQGRCEAQRGVGEPCASSADACSRDAICDPGSKTCVARLKDGEICGADDECASDDCAGRVCRRPERATMLRLTRGLSLFCSAE